jgi:hypothetical protein
MAATNEIRVVPPTVLHKWRKWRNSAIGWKAVHYIAGFVSAALSTVIAINTKTSFLSTTSALVMAASRRGCHFL